LRRQIGEAIDALQMRWYRYVINYTLEDQAEAALSLRDATERLWQSLSRNWRMSFSMNDETGGDTGVPWRALAFVLTLAAIAAWGWRWGRRDARSPGGAIPLVTRSYLTLLQALAARGLEKRAAETPLEFYRRIAPRLDGHASAVAEVTALYHEARFSGRPGSTPALDRAVEQVVAALAVEAPATGPGEPG
jgi:hypothetical protein